ncbi:MAG: glycoside hydrolase family 65 protein [Thermoleophilaceae bacterium]|nr:glycoside hydrolase family 65 protein [Thermoleophilaceae bacterium]
MAEQERYGVDPWTVIEHTLDLDRMAQSESVFALSNGHVGIRGNLDEGEPNMLPGTYLNGFYELRPLPHAELGYGYPETGQTVVNVTNGKLIRLLVEDEMFDLRYGEVRSHERILDFRAGLLRRVVEWVSPTGQAVRVTSTRMVSLVQRAIVAVHYCVEPLGEAARVVLQSELVANEPLLGQADDPRSAAILERPLQPRQHASDGMRATLAHATEASNLLLAVAMDHTLAAPDGTEVVRVETEDDLARLTIASDLPAGGALELTKFVAYGWSSRRSLPSLRGQVEAALAEAAHTGWDGLVASQRAYLDEYWEAADVELDGDPELQQAVRFGMFQGLQNSARAEGRAIPAKGLTGPGYDGHAFWDAETYVLPLLIYTRPEAAADVLRWRHSILPAARERAKELGLKGATFPWRTLHGEESSGYWPAGTAAFHVNASIADAVTRYLAVVGDEHFERDVGTELLVETARLWLSLGHYDLEGEFRIDGVTGPDEYSALADDNIYTNLMAQKNLRSAADSCGRQPDRAAELGVGEAELGDWRAAAEAMAVPYDERLEVHPQAEGFTEHKAWDFEAVEPDRYPLLLHFPYFELYRRQVVKQADLVMALYLRGDAFTPEEKERNFAYYEPLTVRDSSLSAAMQAIVAAEVGHVELAYEYLAESALMDLDDLQRNTGEGLHIASLAGGWLAVVAGFGGMRDHDGELSFRPRMPAALDRISFRVSFRGSRIQVELNDGVTYRLLDGAPIEVTHEDERITITAEPLCRELVAPSPSGPTPTQPRGRAPRRRRALRQPPDHVEYRPGSVIGELDPRRLGIELGDFG